jgi:hypothetical protein
MLDSFIGYSPFLAKYYYPFAPVKKMPYYSE